MALKNKPRQVRTGYEVYTTKSSNSRRDHGQSSRSQFAIAKRLPRVQAGKGGKLALAVATGILVIWALGSTLVSTVRIAGTTNLSNKEVERLIRSSISRNPWYASYFTVGGLKLDRTLPEQEPRIKTAAVKKTFPSTITVTIVERQPGVVWVSAGENWEVDVEGIIIGAAGSNKPMATVIDTANIPVKPGDRVAPRRFVKFAQVISEQLPGKTGLVIENFQVPESTSEVYIKTSKGYSIKFDTTRQATDQLNDLALVLKNLNGKVPGQYIDLRVAGRAYYQ